MTGSTIERRTVEEGLTAEAFYDAINARQLAAIKNTVAKGLSDAEVAWFLEMARSLNLSPWAREIWAAKSEGRNGREGQLLIMVGRDGLLRKAEDFPDYRGYDAGVVHENDEFMKGDPDPDAKTLRARAGVSHRHGVKNRGPIIGAWCVAERENRPPRYFFAEFDEYMPVFDQDWKAAKSAWGKNPSVMIEKVAISVSHRTLINLSGVYVEGETDRILVENEAGPGPQDQAAIRAMIMELEVPRGMREELADAIERLNALSPNAWGPATVQMKLAGRSERDVGRVLMEVEQDITSLLPVDDESVITDAEVVSPDDAEAAADAAPEDPETERELERIENGIADLEAGLEDEDLPGETRELYEKQLAEHRDRANQLRG